MKKILHTLKPFQNIGWLPANGAKLMLASCLLLLSAFNGKAQVFQQATKNFDVADVSTGSLAWSTIQYNGIYNACNNPSPGAAFSPFCGGGAQTISGANNIWINTATAPSTGGAGQCSGTGHEPNLFNEQVRIPYTGAVVGRCYTFTFRYRSTYCNSPAVAPHTVRAGGTVFSSTGVQLGQTAYTLPSAQTIVSRTCTFVATTTSGYIVVFNYSGGHAAGGDFAVDDFDITSNNFGTAVLSSPVICAGGSTSISGLTNNGSGVTQQWEFSTTNLAGSWGDVAAATGITGVTSTSLSLTGYDLPSGQTVRYFRLRMNTLCGQPSYSNVVTLTVNQPPSITASSPSAQSVCQNATPTNLSVTASSAGTISYQWFDNGSTNSTTGGSPVGSNSPTFLPPTNLTGTNYYYVRVSSTSNICVATTTTFEVIVNVRDYGNLPTATWAAAYATILPSNKTWLGSATATSECGTLTTDPADGLQFPGNGLSLGSTRNFSITVNGDAAGTRVNWGLFFDWDNNGTFEDGYYGNGVCGSPITYAQAVNVPSSVNASWKVRLVAKAGSTNFNNADRIALNAGTLVAVNGEVEDFAGTPPLPPVAQNITTTTMNNSQGQTTIGSLLATDPQGAAITGYIVTTLPSSSAGVLFYNGVLAVAGTSYPNAALFTFDPAATFTGTVTFPYTATSANGTSNTATVTIPIINNPPVAISTVTGLITNNSVAVITPPLIAMDGDGTVTSFNITGVPNPATQGTYTYCSNAPTGVVPACTGGSLTTLVASTTLTPAQSANLYFTPIASFTGNAVLTFTVTDNNSNVSNIATHTIPVISSGGTTGNLPPITSPVTTAPILNTAAYSPLTGLVGMDPDGSVANFNVTSLPASGTLYFCSSLPSTPCTTPASFTAVTSGQSLNIAQAAGLVYTPDPANSGTSVTFNFTCTDNIGLVSNTSVATVPILNPPPTAFDVINPIVTPGSSNVQVSNLLATDNNTVATYTITTAPNVGTQGTLSYCSNGATAPTCTGGTLTTVTNGVILTPAQQASMVFTPVVGFTGIIVVPYTATDNNGEVSNTANLTIPVGIIQPPHVLAVISPPTAYDYTSAPINANSTSNLNLPVALTSTDPDGVIGMTYNALTLPPASQGILYYCITPPSTGCGTTLAINTPLTAAQVGTISFDPNPGYSGPVNFTYQSTDNTGLNSNIANVNIPVINNPPVAISYTTAAITPGGSLISTPISGYDAESTGSVVLYNIISIPPATQGVLSISGVPLTVGQQLTPAQAALVVFTPASSLNVSNVSFGFTTTDNTGSLSNWGVVTIPVNMPVPLPITLLSFNAQKQSDKGLLTWVTASEQNTNSFEVQHSSNSKAFSTIGVVAAAGNSTTLKYYSFVHNNPSEGVNYYRLKMKDFNGTLTLSAIRVLNFANGSIDLIIYPNPANNEISISGLKEGMQIKIVGIDGKLIATQNVTSTAETIDLSSFASGLYTIQTLLDNVLINSIKFIKQ